MTIPNIDETRSRRSYNRYILEYQSVLSEPDDAVQNAVLMETSFAEVSFPTAVLPVHSYIGDMMVEEAPEELKNFRLEPFEMKVQGLDRTLADKVFAICDYYMQNRVKKHSRHIYDIYKLLQIIPQTDEFKALVKEVRDVRAMTNICPSAQSDVNVPEMLKFLIENEIYKEDYENITARILEEDEMIKPYVEDPYQHVERDVQLRLEAAGVRRRFREEQEERNQKIRREYLRMLNKRMHLGMLTPVEAFLEHDPKIPYDNSGTEWHISYYSEEDRKRIDTVMQSYGCENYTLHPDIAQCIETFKK